MGLWRKATSRVGASAVALLFALALVEAAHHRATAAHGYCTDHGRQIHLEHPPRSSVAPGSPRVRADVHLHGAHDCLALAFLAESQAATARAATGRLLRQKRIPLGHGAAAGLPRAIALHRLSPSHSPPGPV